MTDQEILSKAIQKSIAGGWEFFPDSTLLPSIDWIIPDSITTWNSFLNDKVYIPQQCVIFNKQFAKALWSDDKATTNVTFNYKGDPMTIWQYNLCQMVLADDPIEYLGKNI